MLTQRLLSLCVLLLIVPSIARAQEGTVRGIVIDAESETPLPGANVVLQEITQGAATDLDGRFEINNVPYGTYTLTVSFIGYQGHEETLTVDAPTTELSIQLAPDYTGLEEVVVIGYGERQRRDITGSVSTVPAEELATQPVSTMQQLIQGRTPGVQVATAGGVAGNTVNVRVRGPSSIEGGNSPLYVVDGVPIITGKITGDVGQGTNALANLNPNDIESIEVLKDASATAIYGSRGANGVVLITTKQGRAQGFTEFNLNYYVGSVDAVEKWDVLNGAEWSTVYREAFDNYARHIGEEGLVGSIEQELGYPAVPDPASATDYGIVDEAFRVGMVQNVSLSARGGDQRTRYYVSGAYYNTDGYIIENNFRRASGLVNLEHDPFDWLQIGAKITLTRSLNNRAPTDNLVSGTLTSSALRPPILPVYNDDGTFNFDNAWNIADNSVGVAYVNDYTANSWRTLGDAFVEVRPITDLIIRVFGANERLFVDEYYRYSELSGDGAPNGYGQQTYRETNNWIVNATANYITSLGASSRINALVGVEYQRNARRNVTSAARGFATDLLPNVESGAEKVTTTSSVDESWGLESYFGRASYTLLDRYIVEASARIDGSSRFGENNRYGFFPSLALAWRLSEESFMRTTGFFDDLKLRTSYGIAGNDQIGTFESLALFESGADYADQPGLAPSQLRNPDLSWENTAMFDVGLDATFLNQRLYVTADYYVKNTTDLLLPVQVPLSSGFVDVTQNVGSMRNRGVEFLVDAQLLTGAFALAVRANAAYNENEVTELVGDEDIIDGNQRAREGEPLGSFYLIRWAGVDPETGDPQWLTADGEVTTSPSQDDRVIAGQVDPDWFGGFGSTVSFKGVTLDAFFQYQIGGHVYNDTYRFMMSPLTWNLHRDYLDRWQQPGDQTDVPRNIFADPLSANRASTRFLEDASYLRLKDVTLSYQLPSVFVDQVGLRSARIYVQGTNLITWSKVSVGDPEGSTDAETGNLNRGVLFFTPPPMRMITGGIQIGF